MSVTLIRTCTLCQRPLVVSPRSPAVAGTVALTRPLILQGIEFAQPEVAAAHLRINEATLRSFESCRPLKERNRCIYAWPGRVLDVNASSGVTREGRLGYSKSSFTPASNFSSVKLDRAADWWKDSFNVKKCSIAVFFISRTLIGEEDSERHIFDQIPFCEPGKFALAELPLNETDRNITQSWPVKQDRTSYSIQSARKMGIERRKYPAQSVNQSPPAHDPTLVFDGAVRRRSTRAKSNAHPVYRRGMTLRDQSDAETPDEEPRRRHSATVHTGETEDELDEDADNENNNEESTAQFSGPSETFEEETHMSVKNRDLEREHKSSNRATQRERPGRNGQAVAGRRDVQQRSSSSLLVLNIPRSKKRKGDIGVLADEEERAIKRERSEHVNSIPPASSGLANYEDDDEIMAIDLEALQLRRRMRMKKLRQEGELRQAGRSLDARYPDFRHIHSYKYSRLMREQVSERAHIGFSKQEYHLFSLSFASSHIGDRSD
ncbi:uncharacterized protein MYCFIDRAFT_171686 [Pseudocercospora fijiensis CIRAD86]|uniref:Uncharacterized protein n=1 Tax=Pseudocercospora fijiensis (strain CIRAD86) TaxID=383855 RepID=M3B912_PSEFD|nr:uncharacterized protein MYCFIDRAFT_171686 [Pseudocercospora fijiensis CIRAD86]EME85817.1 hypothetical protein MYCFIDRAFT_171686 [Pseudocercospora fijiensis CIRAD86]